MPQRVWKRRKKLDNRLPFPWARDIHGSVDTKAIYVRRPRYHQHLLYNGKYGSHVIKIQVIVDNHGVPMDVRGPFVGRRHDVVIWRSSRPLIARNGSRFLGTFQLFLEFDLTASVLAADNGYVGVPDCILVTPFKHGSLYDSIDGRRRHHVLQFTDFERDFNVAHRRWRSRVEHYFSFMSRFSILGSRFRGHRPMVNGLLISALKIITHLDAWYLSTRPLNRIPSVAWFPR